MNSIRIVCGQAAHTVSAPDGVTFLEVLQKAGIRGVQAPCGGMGRCRKCAVRVQGPVRSMDTGELVNANRENMLACRWRPAGGCVVHVPDETDMTVLTVGAGAIPSGGQGLGVAADIGTTTVAVFLYDLATGALLAQRGERNAQHSFGADVITRIAACGGGHLDSIRDAVRGQLNDMISDLCRETGRPVSDIRKAAVAGNTVMEHLFAGLDPTGIGVAPFTPESLFGYRARSEECLPDMDLDADVFFCPCVAGYVGGDVTAGLLASGADAADGLRLYIDIGTNGEMALGNRDSGYISCATAAGPAFEGAEIDCGMDGAPGAIDRVQTVGGDLLAHVIGDGPARGICGSGLIDAIAVMLKLGAISETGRLLPRSELPEPLRSRLTQTENGPAFLLRDGVYISTRDVRQVQLAKSAIRAGAETLLHARGKTAADVTELVIAGGFGSFLDKQSALDIGLLPPIPPDRIRHVGNAAGMGAALALTDAGEHALLAFTKRCEYLELSSSKEFMDRYIEYMFFGEID